MAKPLIGECDICADVIVDTCKAHVDLWFFHGQDIVDHEGSTHRITHNKCYRLEKEEALRLGESVDESRRSIKGNSTSTVAPSIPYIGASVSGASTPGSAPYSIRESISTSTPIQCGAVPTSEQVTPRPLEKAAPNVQVRQLDLFGTQDK